LQHQKPVNQTFIQNYKPLFYMNQFVAELSPYCYDQGDTNRLQFLAFYIYDYIARDSSGVSDFGYECLRPNRSSVFT
jgi:hypothetical protein